MAVKKITVIWKRIISMLMSKTTAFIMNRSGITRKRTPIVQIIFNTILMRTSTSVHKGNACAISIPRLTKVTTALFLKDAFMPVRIVPNAR